jgi:hypothetical protein
MDAGAQAGELINPIKQIDEGRDAGSAPCRLQAGSSFSGYNRGPAESALSIAGSGR